MQFAALVRLTQLILTLCLLSLRLQAAPATPKPTQAAKQTQAAAKSTPDTKTKSAVKPNTVAPTRPASSDVRLGPDDVLQITVLRHPELSAPQITVSSAGRIQLPAAGAFNVTGKTPNQLAYEIELRLAGSIVGPDVTVSLRQASVRQVFVLGAVAQPNVYPIKPGYRITEALAAAGGLKGRPDETQVTLARVKSAPVTLTTDALLANPSGPGNLVLLPDDVLTFTALEPKRISVSGDVTRPDVYELRRAPRLLDAIVAAGGLKQRTENTRAFLIRNAQRINVDVEAASEVENSAANIPLQAGDLLIFEAIPALRVSVDGFVRTPGNYELTPNSGVIQAVAQAGGLTVPADQVVAGVRRGRDLLPIDLLRASTDPAADVELQTGDIVLLSEPQVVRVQVTGQVRTPGALRLPTAQSTLLDALARAGGPTLNPASARISVLRQSNGKPVTLRVDPPDLLEARDLRQNIQLQDGDLVSVTEARTPTVFVSGEVLRPGPYELKEGDGVPELIARAGGPTPDAALSHVVLQRGDTTTTLSVYAAFQGSVSALSPAGIVQPVVPQAVVQPVPLTNEARPGGALQEGDFVVVPRNVNRVLVIQSVQKPGYYSIPENGMLTVAEAISLAGGPRDRASVKEVAVLRATPQGTQRRIIPFDKIFKGDLTQNITLQPGDVVYVPENRVKPSVLAQLGGILGLGIGVRAVTGG